MTRKRFSTLEPPRRESLPALTVVGLERPFTGETWKQAAELWKSFAAWSDVLAEKRLSKQAYGVMWDDSSTGGAFHYLAGVETSANAEVPQGLKSVVLAAHDYAVFTHRTHVSELFKTTCLIYQEWLPKADVGLADAHWFERYAENFDPQTGLGLIEIYIPIVVEEDE